MNKNLHRLIFNHARGLRMAVQEAASSCGKAQGATHPTGLVGPSAPVPQPGLKLLLGALLICMAGSLSLLSTAHAQIVADPSAPANQRPAITTAPNGVPLVNIQTPSAAGVSRNTYQQFDVNAQGTILNNARTNAQTQLGGWVAANPWLAGGAARVILNEINSSNPSQLRGFVEVAGSRAEVVIANPAGVNINGGGFINASRATITTGTPVMNGGNLEGYVVQKGLVSISGAGLDSSQTDFTGIIARAVEVNAGIWAQELKVTTGANQVNAAQTIATPLAGSGTVPTFALDVSQLGGMYAGKITLVGTEAGVGVRNAGTLGATAGNVAVSVDGLLTNTGAISSSGNTALTAQSLNNTGQISALGQVAITATASLTNSGTITGQQTDVRAATIDNQGTGRLEGSTLYVAASEDLANSGQIIASGQLDVAATGTLDNQGKIVGQQTNVQAAVLNNTSAARLEGDALTVTADTINNSGGIVGDAVTLNAGTLNNQGSSALIAATTEANLYVRDQINNTGQATIYSLGDLNIAASNVKDGDGTLLNRTALVNNNTSLIQADGDMQIAAEVLNNTRAAPQITSTTSSSSTALGKRGDYWMCEYGNYVDNFAGFCAAGYADLSWYNPAVHINPYAEKPGMWIGGHAVETERYTTTTVTSEQLQGALQPEPKLLAGRNMILRNVGNLRNEYGSITAGQNVTIGNTDPFGSYQTASVTNVGAVLNRNTVVHEYSIFRWNRDYGSATAVSVAPQSSTTVLGRVGGTMSAGGTFTISAGSVVNTNALPGQSATSGPASPGPSGTAFTLPPLSALVITPPTNPGQRYLVESDPRFANYRQWLSSDYMLNALNLDPAATQKRLGDGFYEQKLIREQVAELTGRRFLQGYQSEEAQYQALMTSGVTVAQQWNLRPGIALSAAQISQLTSDIVWLVEQTVTLTDGSQVQALVPVVYLSQIHTADLRPTGALISGQSINIAAKGDLTNNGALQAQSSILLAANKVTNELGLIDASQGSTKIVSDTDIINRSGLISGNTVQLDAARDIRIDTLTRQFTSSQQTVAGRVTGTNTELGPQGAIVSRGTMALAAGRDVQLAGAFLSAQGNASLSAGANLVVDTVQTSQSTLDIGNSGMRQTHGVIHLGSTLQAGGNLTLASGGDTTLKAAQVYAGQDLSVVSGGNLTITAAKDTAQLDENLRAKNYVRIDHTVDERVVGSSLTAGGNVTLAALQAVPGVGKGNITIEGSSVNAQGGTLAVVADGNVNVVEAREQHEYDLYNKTTKKGFLSSKSTSEHNTGTSNLAVGSSLSGKEVSIVSGKDITVRGSSVISDDKTRLVATNNVTIEAASNSIQDSQLKQQTRSGLFGSGGLSVTWGKQQQSADTQNTRSTATVSTVGSIGGNVVINAGDAYKQVGSDVLAPGGDISINAKKVDIIEARETSKTVTEQKFRQSGLTLAITSPVISAIETVQQMSKAAGDTSDGRMQLLAAANAGLAANNAAKAIKAGQGTDFAGKSNQMISEDAMGNMSGRDATTAERAGGIDLSISIGGSKNQSTSTSQSDTARGSSVMAGGSIAIIASGAGQDSNLTIQGSVVEAGKSALIFADNQIRLLAAQNIASQNSNNTSSSGSIGISIGTNGFLINASGSRGRGNADGADTNYTNTQVKGGSDAGNTVTLISGGDTTLKGAVVAANQVKADVGGNLNVESLQDASTYTGKQQSFGGSISVGYGNMSGSISASKSNVDSNYQSVTQQSGIKTGDGGFDVKVGGNTDLKGAVIASTDKAVNQGRNTFTAGGGLTTSDLQNTASYSGKSAGISIGTGYSGGNASLNGAGVGMGKDEGNASSTTSSGISGIAANTAVRSTDPETGIARIFDADKVQREINAQVAITQYFGQHASKAVGDYAEVKLKDANALRAQAQDEPNSMRAEQLNAEAQALEDNWGDRGTLRLLAHTTIGGLTGGASGAAGAAAGTLTAPAVAQALADAGIGGSLASILTGLASTAVGGAIGGAAGAGTALNEVTNNYLNHNRTSMLRLSEREKYEAAISGCDAGDTAACGTRDELAALSKQRDRELAQACSGQTPELCNSQKSQAIAMGNKVYTTPTGVTYANSPLYTSLNTSTIGPASDPRRGTFHDAVARSTAEALLLEAGGQAIGAVVGVAASGIGVTSSAVKSFFSSNGVVVADETAIRIATNFGRDGDRFTIAAEEMVAAKGANWVTAEGKVWWPMGKNGSVPGTEFQTALPVGTKLDRYGSIGDKTDFLAPAGTPYGQRALIPGSESKPLVQLEVLKPLPVQQSNVMPWFGEAGMGVQYQTTAGSTGWTIQRLIREGYLKEIP